MKINWIILFILVVLASFVSAQIKVVESNSTDENQTEEVNITVVPPVVEEEVEEEEVDLSDITEVSICEGCIVKKECLKEGTQKDDEAGLTYYCGLENKMLPVKSGGEFCGSSYECGSFRCVDSSCVALVVESESGPTSNTGFIIFLVILTLGLIGGGILYTLGFDFKNFSFPQDIKKKRKADNKKEDKKKVKLKEHKFAIPDIESTLARQKTKFKRKDVDDTESKLRDSLERFKKFRR